MAVSLYIGKYAGVDKVIPENDLKQIIYLTCSAYLLGDQNTYKAKIIHNLTVRDFIVFKGEIMPPSKIDKINTINNCGYYLNKTLKNHLRIK